MFFSIKSILNKTQKKDGGFTLLEVLLYVSISAVLLGAMVIIISVVMNVRVKNRVVLEVEEQGVIVLSIVSSVVRNAISIGSPVTSTSAGTLSLVMSSSTVNPTVIDAIQGVFRIKEGVGLPINITNSRVVVSDLVFTNYSYLGTPGIISVAFTLSGVTTSLRNEYEYKQNFYGSTAIR